VDPNVHPPEFYRGVNLFNRGFYFECHDVWEEIWGGAKGKEKVFYQALIMSAVSLYHYGNENLEGALSCLQKALRQFSQLPGEFLGLSISDFVEQMKQFYEGMAVGQTEFTEELLKRQRPVLKVQSK
jgi:predicted metal-dependent hydrolase